MSSSSLYSRFYVNKKSLLFPLIEKYTGESMEGKTHGEVVQIYSGLLNINAAFKNEVDEKIKTLQWTA
jgi:hypothetical protein